MRVTLFGRLRIGDVFVWRAGEWRKVDSKRAELQTPDPRGRLFRFAWWQLVFA